MNALKHWNAWKDMEAFQHGFPNNALLAFRRRKSQQNEPHVSEIERIDRIRNPSKYLGR